MTTSIDASSLSLGEVENLLNFQQQLNNSIDSLLSLERLTQLEEQELNKIRSVFASYYRSAKVTEGQVKLLFVAPLLWLARFYDPNINICLEEGIEEIIVEEDKIIKGRMDILAATKADQSNIALWILIIESKRILFNASSGLPQLLTYAYKSLSHQDSVWGLTTNGANYQFVYIQQNNPPVYQLFPELSLIWPESAIKILQILKAICKPYISNESC